MKTDLTKMLLKKKRRFLNHGMQFQLADDSLREDLMTNDDLRSQSDELLEVLLKSLNDQVLDDISSADMDAIYDVISEISISRARQGYSPRETGAFILSLKEALNKVIQDEYKDNTELRYKEILRINKIVDHLSILTFETFYQRS